MSVLGAGKHDEVVALLVGNTLLVGGFVAAVSGLGPDVAFIGCLTAGIGVATLVGAFIEYRLTPLREAIEEAWLIAKLEIGGKND